MSKGEVKRISADDLDGDGIAAEFWYRKGKPVTGLVFAEIDGRVIREGHCRQGMPWGPQRIWYSDGEPHEAYYCLAGQIQGIRRIGAGYGRKHVLEEYRFGVQVRRREWRPDGTIETSLPLEGPNAARYEEAIEKNRRFVLSCGGDPNEVPASFLNLQPGEWDDLPTPNDVTNWLVFDRRA